MREKRHRVNWNVSNGSESNMCEIIKEVESVTFGLALGKGGKC